MGEPLLTIQEVVAYLNAARIRATYGAVAEVTGGIARGIGQRLTAIYTKSPEASWVVSAATGEPSGYSEHQRHPALKGNQQMITSGDDLRQRVVQWKRTDTQVSVRPTDGTLLRSEHRPASPALSVNDLGDLRRKLMSLLDRVDAAKLPGEGVRKRIGRLSQTGGPLPRHIAALMVTITEMRNSAEYESKRLSPSESLAVMSAWQAIQDWAQQRPYHSL